MCYYEKDGDESDVNKVKRVDVFVCMLVMQCVPEKN